MLRIAFYRAHFGRFSDRLINYFTDSIGFSHVELIFPNNACFSSRAGSGCEFLSYCTAITPPADSWEIFDLPFVQPETVAWLQRYECQKYVGQYYDWFGAVRFVLPFFNAKLSRRRQFCSEVILRLFKTAGFFAFANPRHISPNELYLMCKSRISTELLL